VPWKPWRHVLLSIKLSAITWIRIFATLNWHFVGFVSPLLCIHGNFAIMFIIFGEIWRTVGRWLNVWLDLDVQVLWHRQPLGALSQTLDFISANWLSQSYHSWTQPKVTVLAHVGKKTPVEYSSFHCNRNIVPEMHSARKSRFVSKQLILYIHAAYAMHGCI
jgi:hypothetical protein